MGITRRTTPIPSISKRAGGRQGERGEKRCLSLKTDIRNRWVVLSNSCIVESIVPCAWVNFVYSLPT